jgi:hypothetical protein
MDKAEPEETLMKSLRVLKRQLQWLAGEVGFSVTVGSVLGGGRPEEALIVARHGRFIAFHSTVCIAGGGGGHRTALVAARLVVIALSIYEAFAQDFRGSLAGTVTDDSGGRIVSASVVLTGDSSLLDRSTRTDERGEFRLTNLVPGSYRLTVQATGFEDAAALVSVVVRSERDVRVTLHPAAGRQSINVPGAASTVTDQAVNTAGAVQGAGVMKHDLEALPLAQRSFANIAYLIAGTEPVEPSDPTKARITAVSTGGSSGLNNVLSVDGGDNSDDYIGGFLQNFSPDAIQEFAFETSQQDADTGRTVGGSVAITTRRGADVWHGGGAFYERAAAMNARFPIENPAPLPKQPFSRQSYIATLGGPVVKDKLWFFSSLEGVHEDASIAYSPASQAQFTALASLAAQGLIPAVPSIAVPNTAGVPFRDYMGKLRLDWAQSSRVQWFLRAATDNYTSRNAFVQQGSLPSTGATSHSGYLNLVAGQQFLISPQWLETLTLAASGFRLANTRNSDLGYAFAFPFSSTAQTISGFETLGDNQFLTPITAFPIRRSQEKYQIRSNVARSSGSHSLSFGVEFIQEPVLSGEMAANAESLTVFARDPIFYAQNANQFVVDSTCIPSPTLPVTEGTSCTSTPAHNGVFTQSVRRFGVYAQDSWRVTPRLTVNLGLRYDTTFGLFTAEGRPQSDNPALATLRVLQVPFFDMFGAPADYRLALAPRLGIAFTPGASRSTAIRAGIGLYYNDLAQNGWVSALQAVNEPPGACTKPGDPGCLPSSSAGGAGAIIDPAYKTPYALHSTAGVDHALNSKWTIGAHWIHETGMRGYRRYQYQAGYTMFSPLYPSDIATQQQYVPDVSVFRADNRSRYDALTVRMQGNTSRLSVVAHYTLSSAQTWGCVLGELFDYVNGVCNPTNAFAHGDYGPSGEDVRHRFVLAGTLRLPVGFELTFLSQAESARPFTMTTPADVNGLGDPVNNRAVVNGVQTQLDEFRGTPYIQTDLRMSRRFVFRERWKVTAFMEFFNLFNRSNPGANYVTNLAALPTPVNSLANATALCLNEACTETQAITSLNQLRVPAGALGDFFGPGTTVGIPFAAQLGIRLSF